MTADSVAGASTPPAGMPATGPTGTGTGAGRHTGGKPTRDVRRPARLSVSNWPVSARLAAVFIAASVMGLVFGGLRVAGAVDAANGYARTTQLAVLGKQITLLAQDLENERDLTVGTAAMTQLQEDAVAAKAGPAVNASLQQALTAAGGRLADARRATTSAVVPVRQLAQDVLSNPAFPQSVRDGASSVVAEVSNGDLDAVRLEVLGQSPPSIIEDYSAISDLFALNDQLSGSSGDALLSNEVSALGALSQAEDQAAQQRAILDAAFIESGLNDAGGGKPTKADPTGAPYNNIGGSAAVDYAGGLQAFTTAQDLQLTDLQTFQLAATPAESEAYVGGQTGSQVGAAGNIYTTVTSDNGDLHAVFPQLKDLISGFTPTAAPTLWYADQSAAVDAMQTTANQIAAQILTRSQVLQHQAFESALITAVATALVILLVLGGTALIGHTLVSPLRRLQADALEIAAVRLPARVAAAAAGTEVSEGPPMVEPIGVQSTDEIGRVARAFDQVHAEAVRLAGTEAQLRGSLNSMFISLSRRSVPLIERLARMIDEMEQNEDDPDQLAKLFSMDHMITRMRRNSENLLVLGGEEPVRKWTESVPLTDITRAAAAEIEQYSRVALAVQPGIMVSGHAAADIVHLLAELIENATLFSPQSTRVPVTVMELGSGGVLIEVRDDGVGISPLRLADINWRLDHPPVVDVSISRHMGLYAVSRLAARHGIRVKLRPGTPQGLSALVWLPGDLAKREQATAASGHTGPHRIGGKDPAARFRSETRARQGVGRHRSRLLAASGGQPLVPERADVRVPEWPDVRVPERADVQVPERPDVRTQQSARPATVWFAAKRPSDSDARSQEELAARWQPRTQAWPAAGQAGQSRTDDLATMPEPSGLTTSGLPRRVPRTSAYPGSGMPDFGLPAVPVTPAAEVPVLGAPPGGRAPQGASYAGAQYQERVPARRRSPEAARSRLSGFQLGSRDAGQAGHAAVTRPLAGEENSR
jgi:signal transduction histidine kinase